MKKCSSQFRFHGALAILLCFSAFPLFSRPVNPKSPDELFQIADVVINGEVLSVRITDETSTIALGSNKPLQIRIAVAQIEQLASFKRPTAPEILLRFPVLDRDKHVRVMNGPNLPNLQAGERYHFYLVQAEGELAYETALNDDFDSGFSIHPFAAGEDPKNPPLLKKEAERLAVNFFEKHRDLPPNSQLSSSFRRNGWTVRISTEGGLYYPAFTYDASIGVTADRQISTDSVVGREIPRKGEWLDKSGIHTKVRLTVAGHFTENGYQHKESSITELVGQIDSVSDSSISGTFSSKSFEPDSPPKEISFPREALKSVQRIF
jgi:hypothetical protein